MVFLLIALTVLLAPVFTTSEPGEYDWIVATSDYSKDQDSLNDALKKVEKLTSDEEEGNPRNIPSNLHSLFYIYEHKESKDRGNSEDILTNLNIQSMCLTEREMFQLPEYQEFCVLDKKDKCANATLSLPLQYYGFDHDWSCELLDESVTDAKTKEMLDLLETDIGLLQYGFFFDKDTVVNKKAVGVRSLLQFGAPLEGFASESEDISAQYKLYEDFFAVWEKEIWAYFKVINTGSESAYQTPFYAGDLHVRFWGFDVQQLEFQRIVQTDMLFSIFSIMFVYYWMTVHTGSLFLASLGMLQIVCSLPIGNGIYKLLFGIEYFDTLHTLVIFLVLGVGADDIFVLNDGWTQTAEIVNREDYKTEVEYLGARMQIAYARTAQAVFNTSFTTSMAFVATAISPIMPISTFGIFAALCIVINYFMVITVTPTFILFHHVHVKKHEDKMCAILCCLCNFFKKNATTTDSSDFKERDELQKEKAEIQEGTPNNELEDGKSGVAAVQAEPATGIVEVFFEKAYIPTMMYEIKGYKVVALFSVIVCFIWGAFQVNNALKLTPPQQQEQWFPSTHMFTGFIDDNSNMFLGGTENQYVTMNFYLGIDGIDRNDNAGGGSFNIYEPNTNRGTVMFNDDFDITNSDTQADILNACQELRDQPCTVKGGCENGKLVRFEGVVCFLEEFDAWLISDKSTTRGALSSADFLTHLTEFRADTKPKSDPIVGSWESQIGVIEGKIKFITIQAVSSMQLLLPVDVKVDVRKAVDDVLEKINLSSKDHPTTGEMKTEAGISWTWMITELGLVESLFQGFAICFPVAFMVILVATGNLIVSFFAIFCIIFIVGGVMGLVQFLGWDLGVAESIAGIIVVGFSVDYAVHLAHMYMEGFHAAGMKTRGTRFEYACSHMGSTVVAGAVTTAGSGIFMLLCQLSFFVKMATLIVSTIIYSLTYAMCMFMPLLLLWGPDTTFGDVNVVWIKENVLRKRVIANE